MKVELTKDWCTNMAQIEDDAAEHWGGRWSLVIDGPAPNRNDCADALDEAVDAAMARTRAVSDA